MMALNQHHAWCFECSRDFKSATARPTSVFFCCSLFRSIRTHWPVAGPTSSVLLPRNVQGVPPESQYTSGQVAIHSRTHDVTAAVHKIKIVPTIFIKQITDPVQPPTLRNFFCS
ncbi:hypothetical protein BYT27DRAFT_7195923 [Phlegmacium glaucopus]|nr:hypothetical protein BYT27DRAFT_7195923 [Phlegmacium glaucopus]